MPEFGQALFRECIRDWKPYYVNYNRLKGWIKEMQDNNSKEAYTVFFEELETNLKRVDAFYLAQEAQVQAAIKDLCEVPPSFVAEAGEEQSHRVTRIMESIEKLQCFAEMNCDGFRKITKKFDKKVGAPNSAELPEGLQKRMLEVIKTYNFSAAGPRLDKCISTVKAWEEGHEAVLPRMSSNDPSFMPLGVPLLDQQANARDARRKPSDLSKLAAYLWACLSNSVGLLVLSLAVVALAVASPSPKLNRQSYLVIWVTVVVLAFLVKQHAPDSVLMAATLLLTVCGILEPKEAWKAFSNEVVLSVAGLGVIAVVVGETGIIDLVFKVILGRPTSLPVAMLRLMLPAMVLNLGISNTCVMSCLLPVIDTWSKDIGMHKAFFLMPLSYLLLISGVFAIFSTSTNLVAQGLLILHHQPQFDNFALAVPVAVSSLVTLAYLLIATPLVLKRFLAAGTLELDRRASVIKRNQNRYDVRVQVLARSLEDQTLQSSGILDLLSGKIGDVFSLERYGSHLEVIDEDVQLKLDDILWLRTSVEGIVALFYTPGLVFLALDLSEDYATLDPSSRQLVEAVLDRESPLIGHRIGDARAYRPEYNCPIVAFRAFSAQQGKSEVSSNGEHAFVHAGPGQPELVPKGTFKMGRAASGSHNEAQMDPGMNFARKVSWGSRVGGDASGPKGKGAADTEVRLAPGDHIILNAPNSFYNTWKESTDFVVLRKVTAHEPERLAKRHEHAAPVSGCILLGLIGLVASSTLPLLEAVFVAIAALAVSRCTTMDSIVRGVKLRTTLTIVGAFGLGKAIGKAHVAEVLADILIFALGPFGRRGLLVAIFAATVSLGVIFHGTAVVVLMFPICQEVSEDMNVPIHQIIAVLCIAVSCQFLSPISYQTNLMAYSTGAYQFADFTKLGAGLVLCIAVVAVPMCELYFPD